MTREQQRKLRELKKALPKILKEKIKKYKIKKKEYMLWYTKEDLILDCHIDVRTTTDNRCVCTTGETVKPLWIDDLLWDFIGMPNNKKEPLSLRAIGAFTVSGADIYTNSKELMHWDIEELEVCVEAFVEHFYQTVQIASLQTFFEHIDSSCYHEELRKSLSYIYYGKYKEALMYLRDFDQGRFCNKNIWVNDAIREYCRRMIEEK